MKVMVSQGSHRRQKMTVLEPCRQKGEGQCHSNTTREDLTCVFDCLAVHLLAGSRQRHVGKNGLPPALPCYLLARSCREARRQKGLPRAGTNIAVGSQTKVENP